MKSTAPHIQHNLSRPPRIHSHYSKSLVLSLRSSKSAQSKSLSHEIFRVEQHVVRYKQIILIFGEESAQHD